MLLFSTVINERRGKKLISKTIKHKLDSSSKMKFAPFYPRDIQKYFLKAIDFIGNLEMTQIAGGGGTGGRGTIFSTSYDAMSTKIDMWFTPEKYDSDQYA